MEKEVTLKLTLACLIAFTTACVAPASPTESSADAVDGADVGFNPVGDDVIQPQKRKRRRSRKYKEPVDGGGVKCRLIFP